MPYEISFKKTVTVADPEIYINDCCWGGDTVRDFLLPAVECSYEDISTDQEDWGWFIWFKKGNQHLGIEIMADSKEGDFRVHVDAARVRFFGLSRRFAEDTPEVDELVEKVSRRLKEWPAEVKIVRTDMNFTAVN